METVQLLSEVWMDVIDFEGYYQISNFGRVKSLSRKIRTNLGNMPGYRLSREKILKPSISDGYYGVILSKNRKIKRYLVHRLVAEAFIPNPNNLPEVNHKDENTLNNHVSNLEWCDRSYNINYGLGIKKRSKQREMAVCQYTLDGILVNTWDSAREIHRITGYSSGNIQGCCTGRKKTAYGYIWKYK